MLRQPANDSVVLHDIKELLLAITADVAELHSHEQTLEEFEGSE